MRLHWSVLGVCETQDESGSDGEARKVRRKCRVCVCVCVLCVCVSCVWGADCHIQGSQEDAGESEPLRGSVFNEKIQPLPAPPLPTLKTSTLSPPTGPSSSVYRSWVSIQLKNTKYTIGGAVPRLCEWVNEWMSEGLAVGFLHLFILSGQRGLLLLQFDSCIVVFVVLRGVDHHAELLSDVRHLSCGISRQKTDVSTRRWWIIRDIKCCVFGWNWWKCNSDGSERTQDGWRTN